MSHSHYGPASETAAPFASQTRRPHRQPYHNNHRQPSFDWLNRRHPRDPYSFGTTTTNFYSPRPPAVCKNPGQRVDCQRDVLLPEGSITDGGSLQSPIGLGEQLNSPSPDDELSAESMGGNGGDIDIESHCGDTSGSGMDNLLCGGIPGRVRVASVTDSSTDSCSGGSIQHLHSNLDNQADLVEYTPTMSTGSTVSALSLEPGLGGDDFDFNPMAISRRSKPVVPAGTSVGKRRDFPSWVRRTLTHYH